MNMKIGHVKRFESLFGIQQREFFKRKLSFKDMREVKDVKFIPLEISLLLFIFLFFLFILSYLNKH